VRVCTALVSRGASRLLLLLVFQLLVEGADAVDAFFSVFLSLKLEAHGHLLELIPFKGELVVTQGLLVEFPNHFLILKDSLVVLHLLWYPVVERDDFSR